MAANVAVAQAAIAAAAAAHGANINNAAAAAAAAAGGGGRTNNNNNTNEHVEFSVRAAEDLYLEGSLKTIRRVTADTNYSCLMLKTQRFSSLFRHYAKYHGLRKDDLQYHFANVLKNDDTPESVQLQRNDVIIVKKKRDDDRPVVTEATRKEYFRDMKDLLQDEECTDCVFHVVSNARHRIDDDPDDDHDDNDDHGDGDEGDNEEEEECTHLRAHKAIVTAQSDYFKALFRKNAFIDGRECIVRVDPAYSVRHVEAVLAYLYTTSTAAFFRMTLTDLLLSLQLADLWLLTSLKAKIEDMLKSHIALHTVTRLYVLAGTKRLRSACLDFILRNLKKLADDTEMQQIIAQDPELFIPLLRAAADLVVLPNGNTNGIGSGSHAHHHGTHHHPQHHHPHASSSSHHHNANNNNNNKRQRTGGGSGGGGSSGGRHPLETTSSMA